MRRFALDTGPLVALLNRRDDWHEWATETLNAIQPPYYSCEAVLSEACFLLSAIPGGPAAVLALIQRGIVEPEFRLGAEASSIQRLMSKYADVPMALADACLVRMSELDQELTIVTVDGDFRVYRRHGRQSVPVLMP